METNTFRRIAFLFPGQGAQHCGMARDFAESFSAARYTFEEADEILKENLSKLIFNGPEEELNQTKNSQVAIYVASMAIFRVVKELFEIEPAVCAGLSLGEYSALTAANWIDFKSTISVVRERGLLMNQACLDYPGAMSVLMGLAIPDALSLIQKVNLPNDLWLANFNCPGQIIMSGTLKGIEAGERVAKEMGAKRVLRLNVHGAFHSGLMKKAEEGLRSHIESLKIEKGSSSIVMNVTGDFVTDIDLVRQNMIHQVTHSVLWEQGIRAMAKENVDLFVEFGPGKTLSGMNKRMDLAAPTLSIEKVEDLEEMHRLIKEGKLR